MFLFVAPQSADPRQSCNLHLRSAVYLAADVLLRFEAVQSLTRQINRPSGALSLVNKRGERVRRLGFFVRRRVLVDTL